VKEFKLLFSPIKVGTMELKNRIIMPAMGVSIGSPDGTINERLFDYHVARAKGGAALNITEITYVDPAGQGIPSCPAIWDDKFIPGLAELAKAVHAYGGKLAIQLHHAGRSAFSFLTGLPIVAPSAVSTPSAMYPPDVPQELTEEEIWELIEKFADGARRAREAGCDAVELHGAHSYLIGQFLSPQSNKRADSFGGNLEGRLKFAVEIIRAIRGKVGRDYPVIFKISGNEKVPCGLTIEETTVMASILEEAGADAIAVSQGSLSRGEWILPASGLPFTQWISDVDAIHRVVSVPVIALGRIGHPLVAEHILEHGKADLIGMGRALIADPDLPNKAAAGNLDDIRYCTYCNTCIESLLITGLRCMVNPEAGREKEMAIVPAERPKKVLVAGSGPGGLEAARVAALRGHEVTVCEKASKVGGQLLTAVIPPGKQELTNAIKYLWTQAEKAGAKIQLGTEVTPALVKEMKPDVVIVATGGVPLIPADIPGIDKEKVVTAHDVLMGKAVVGRKVAILGGGMVGSETADFLGESGRDVTIIEMLDDIALDMGLWTRPFLLNRLAQSGVKKITGAQVKEITDDGVVVVRNGLEETIGGMESIILALGVRSLNELAEQVKGKVPEVYVIGDAKEPRKAVEAISEGAEIARKI